MKWMKNTSGKPDFVLTLAFIGFIVVVLKLFASGGTLVFDNQSFTFGEIGAAEIAAILTPTLGAYVSRRYTDQKFTTSKTRTRK